MLNALTQFSEKILLGKSLRLRKRHRLWQRRREVQLDTASYCLVNSTYSSLLWVSFSTWPNQKAKDQSCGLWATSSSGNCPFPWQKRGTKWSSKSLPRQTIHDSMILKNYFFSSILTLKNKKPRCTQYSDEILYENPSPFSLQARKQTQEHKHDGTSCNAQ